MATVTFTKGRARIVLDDHADMLLAVDVFVHRGDPGRFSGDEHVLGIRASDRSQPDSAAACHPHAADQDAVCLRGNGVVGQRVPPLHTVGYLRDQSGGRQCRSACGLRKMPCRSNIASADMPSH